MANKKDYEAIAHFSEQIKELKKHLGYNHTQMGELFGVSRDTYIHWYNGVTLPNEPRFSDVMSIIAVKMRSE